MLKNLQKQIEEEFKKLKSELEEDVKKILPGFEVSANISTDFTNVAVQIVRNEKISQRLIFSRTMKNKEVSQDISMMSYEIIQDGGLALKVLPTNISLQVINVIFMVIDNFVKTHSADNE